MDEHVGGGGGVEIADTMFHRHAIHRRTFFRSLCLSSSVMSCRYVSVSVSILQPPVSLSLSVAVFNALHSSPTHAHMPEPTLFLSFCCSVALSHQPRP